MRKQINASLTKDPQPLASGELDLAALAQAELSSEDATYPFESALVPAGRGWRAAAPGPATLRLLFDEPQTITRIHLHFQEAQISRSQEYVLGWSADGHSFHDIVRQQWNFNPSAPTETEHHRVALNGVRALQLCITPDIAGGAALASLHRWRVFAGPERAEAQPS